MNLYMYLFCENNNNNIFKKHMHYFDTQISSNNYCWTITTPKYNLITYAVYTSFHLKMIIMNVLPDKHNHAIILKYLHKFCAQVLRKFIFLFGRWCQQSYHDCGIQRPLEGRHFLKNGFTGSHVNFLDFHFQNS